MFRLLLSKRTCSSVTQAVSKKKAYNTDLPSAFSLYASRKYAVKRPKAAALIIGDEILNGTVSDVNTTELAKFLFSRGIEFDRVEVVPDKEDVIIESIKRLSPNHDYLFTSGGIGPTHDDITYPAVAKAFGRELQFHEPTLDKMKEFYSQRKEDLNEARKRMALFPANANVTYPFDQKSWVPLVNIENIYIFPGVPSMFKQMLNNSGPLFPVLPPKARAVVYTNFPEGEIAEFLTNIQNKFPDCRIGSYPTMDANAGYRVKVNVEGDSVDDVEDIARSFQRQYSGFRDLKKPAEADAKKEQGSDKPQGK